MTRPIESFAATRPLTLTAALEFIQIEPNLHAFRQEVSSKAGKVEEGATMTPPRSALPKSVSTGLVDDAGRAALLSGKAPKLLERVVLTNEQLEGFRTKGWSDMEQSIFDNFPRDPFAILRDNPELTADNVVRLDHSSHMLFDRFDKPLPVALYFDYISNHISESTHDLGKLAAHMVVQPNVVVFHAERRTRQPTTDPKKAIFEIPYYNAEEGRSKSIEFLWVPTAEEYTQVWGQCRGQYPSTRLRDSFFELDVADMRQFEFEEPSIKKERIKGKSPRN